MGKEKTKRRRMLVNYCGEITCERILLMLVKVYLEEREGT